MQSFRHWVSQLRIAENYFTFSPRQYDRLFDDELGRIITRTHDSAHLDALERLRGFGWTAYVAAAIRNAGFRDYRDAQESTHDIVAKLLTGELFRDYDESRHGPFDLRFKRSVANAVKNLVEKEGSRRHYLPSVPIERGDDLPARFPAQQQDERLVTRFRELVRKRLGPIGGAVLDNRLAGAETKSLVGCPALGSPGKWTVKRVVGEIKSLAREYALMVGDSELLRRIERAMASEAETIERRRASSRARRQAGCILSLVAS